jgi:serine/threonine protein kinase
MCAYSFPEHVPLSESCKSLVSKILNLDPAKRPNLGEIMNHPFINGGANIPKFLPVSTLACPPSGSYLKQYVHTDKVIFWFLFNKKIRAQGSPNLTQLANPDSPTLSAKTRQAL